MSEDGLKNAIRRSFDRIRDSFVRARILVVEEDLMGNDGLCLERNRVLGASVVRYSIGE